MDNKLMVIDEREVLGKQFRIYGDFENPLFLTKDIAEWIDYGEKNAYRLYDGVDEDERKTCSTFYGGQLREMKFLTEDGLYEVLMQSRKPIAKQFKKQVKEILKSVRKNGMYATDELLDNVELFQATVNKLVDERKARLEAEHQKEIADKRAFSAMGTASGAKRTLTAYQNKVLEVTSMPPRKALVFVINGIVNNAGITHGTIYNELYNILASKYGISLEKRRNEHLRNGGKSSGNNKISFVKDDEWDTVINVANSLAMRYCAPTSKYYNN